MTSDMGLDYWFLLEQAKKVKVPIRLIDLFALWERLRGTLEDINAQMMDNVKKTNSERALREHNRKCRPDYKIVYIGELIREEDIKHDD